MAVLTVLFACLLASVSQAASTGLVAAPGSPYPTGSTAFSSAAGDFNGDGRPDLAVAGGTVAVLLADADGRLSPAPGSPYEAGTFADSIALGDFDGDGNLDAVVSSASNAAISVLLGDGQGRLTLASGSPGGSASRPQGILTGDFNGDGALDVAVANGSADPAPMGQDNTVTVFLGNGQGQIAPAPGGPFRTGGLGAADVAAGDFDRDGDLDLAVANVFSNDVSILAGDGSGHFSAAGPPVPVGSFPGSIAAGDVDGDAILDLVVSGGSGTGANMTVLLGNGDGSFRLAPGSPFGTPEFNGTTLADFDRDGNLDVALVSRDGAVEILLGDGTGRFAAGYGSPYPLGLDYRFLAAADFDRDGMPDLAVVNGFDRVVAVLLNPKTPARFCSLERSLLGDGAFAAKYAKNRNAADAHGQCVSRHSHA
jgi:hypothetical protein